MDDLKIFIVTHKPVISPSDPFYIPIQAGAANRESFGILTDDTKENISQLNPYYSELTAHYWIWKNVSAEFVGLVHYRRFFAPKDSGVVHLGKRIATGLDLRGSLDNHSIILARPISFYHAHTNIPQTLEQQYVSVHGFDIFPTREAIGEVNSAYLDAFDFIMRNNTMYAFNLMVTSKAIFDSYMQWAFEIFRILDQRVWPDLFDAYQARVQAFLSERLLTTWITHNRKRFRIEHRPHVFYGGI